MDVSGFWTGEYAYDSVKGLKVEFKAGLAQTGAILSGDTTEENTFADQCGQILIAELFGKVSAQNVSFTKAYKNGPPGQEKICLLYTSPSPRDRQKSRMPSSA